ncbi:hypothetical protein STENM327S_02193 [Streptomyces tendae]
MKNGSVTVLPEYNGSLLAYLDPKAEQKSVEEVNEAAKGKLDKKLTLLESSPAENKDSVSVNAETAKKYGLTAESTLADLKDAAPDLVIGGSPEFQTRQQGLKGLESVYGLKFKSFKALDAGSPMTQSALTKNTVQAADVFTTDPTIIKEKFVVLKDPENLFGHANVTPLVAKEGLDKEGVAALNAVSAKLDTETLLDLDAQVQLDKKDPLDVAKACSSSPRVSSDGRPGTTRHDAAAPAADVDQLVDQGDEDVPAGGPLPRVAQQHLHVLRQREGPRGSPRPGTDAGRGSR